MHRCLLLGVLALLSLLPAATPLVADLFRARSGGPLVVPPEGLDLPTAYLAQAELTAALVAAGDPVVGVKLGFMASPLREAWGMPGPAWGALHQGMRVAPEDVATGFHQCRVEAEVAFILATDVTTLPKDEAGLQALVASVHPALDLADLRYGPGRPSGAALVADGIAAGRFVLGPGIAPPAADLATAQLVLRIAGAEAGRAPASAVHGSPWAALRWYLHDRLAAGETPPAGLVVLSGAGIAPVAVALDQGPQQVVAEVTGLGAVTVRVH